VCGLEVWPRSLPARKGRGDGVELLRRVALAVGVPVAATVLIVGLASPAQAREPTSKSQGVCSIRAEAPTVVFTKSVNPRMSAYCSSARSIELRISLFQDVPNAFDKQLTYRYITYSMPAGKRLYFNGTAWTGCYAPVYGHGQMRVKGYSSYVSVANQYNYDC
jgi:hypothetical protein